MSRLKDAPPRTGATAARSSSPHAPQDVVERRSGRHRTRARVLGRRPQTAGHDARRTTAATAATARNGGKVGLSPAALVRASARRSLVCVAAIIVYLILAYLVFVRPGASRSEHLLAVLLPAAILALSADLWPRLQAGLRASLALLYGVFALVTGLVCVVRLRVEGLSASGLAGLLPLAAGAVLIALGLWLLWVSRKRGGALWWTLVRRALLLVAALFVVYWVVLPVGMAIVATERPSEPVKAADLGRPVRER